MSAPEPTRTPSPRCVEYLHMSTRRLKSAPAPAADGAGLGPGARYSGRKTPLRGKGTPPAAAAETPAAPAGGIKMVGGHSAKPTDVLHTSRPASAGEGPAFRPNLRYFEAAFASSMTGTSAAVSEEASAKRAVRRHGAEAPDEAVSITQRRVLADSAPLDGSRESWEAPAPSSLRAWKLPEKPVGSGSIIRHHESPRHVEEGPAQLDAGRAPSPNVAAPCPKSSRDAFSAASDGYNLNKARAIYGSSFRFG
ncbi:hypothetical protein MNEG_1280 [Monoraphidium neglectum]|uniref:Uncharacterized protein n=1 Tax=Monoraphidium neglectum TaxID=145388 RepID=A0A0D2NQV0_9CHLO|nr:hypothetical protein MNEG_1280 [Monoraphidium neglectum]KIZ06666.1 hypothetical protein MNEG_1280 [Monoraphidium neglectum]|eukprot:XP_013905685.1 hypothetical protein MNEG_1280 [Monoraphidium neglectum]